MIITVTLQLNNMPDDTSLYEVERVLRCQCNEWLDFDSHPKDLQVSVHKWRKHHAPVLRK